MKKDFDTWNELKKRLEARGDIFCNQREIWWCSIGANIGAEASGKNDLFERPVLVLRVYNVHSVLIVPLTSKPKNDPYHFEVAYGKRIGWLILSHARTISPKRLQRKLYRIDKKLYEQILSSVMELVGKGPKNKSAPLSRGLGARRPDALNIHTISKRSMKPVDNNKDRPPLSQGLGARRSETPEATPRGSKRRLLAALPRDVALSILFAALAALAPLTLAVYPEVARGAIRLGASNNTSLSSGLVGYWIFDGPTLNWNSNTAADLSGQGNVIVI